MRQKTRALALLLALALVSALFVELRERPSVPKPAAAVTLRQAAPSTSFAVSGCTRVRALTLDGEPVAGLTVYRGDGLIPVAMPDEDGSVEIRNAGVPLGTTDMEGTFCLPAEALPASITFRPWPSHPQSEVVADDHADHVFVTNLRCTLGLSWELPVNSETWPQVLLLDESSWETALPLEPSNVTLEVPCGTARLYPAQYWTRPVRLDAEPATFDTSAGPVHVRFLETDTLTVHVINPDGEGIAAAEVLLGWPSEDGRSWYVSRRVHYIIARAPGHVSVTREAGMHGWIDDEVTITLQSSKPVRLLCDDGMGGPGPCPARLGAECTARGVEGIGYCQSEEFADGCLCPDAPDAEVVARARSWAGAVAKVTGELAILRKGSASIRVSAPDGDDVCSTMLLRRSAGGQLDVLAGGECTDGSFVRWEGLFEGEYWLLRQGDGYCGPYYLMGGEHVDIGPASGADEMEIRVRVLNSSGESVGGAHGHIITSEGWFPVLADRNGMIVVTAPDQDVATVRAATENGACSVDLVVRAGAQATCVIDPDASYPASP